MGKPIGTYGKRKPPAKSLGGLGWPLGKPVRYGQVTMTNLIGDEINTYQQWLTVPGATVHLYGKGAARPGRKMGHVTQIKQAAEPPKTA